jgi:hypothetical protein
MQVTSALTVNNLDHGNPCGQFDYLAVNSRLGGRVLAHTVCRVTSLLLLVMIMFIAIQAQVAADEPFVVEGESDTMAYGVGRSIKITGTVKNGAISLGGDVIVQGTVEGDVAAIGGSVIQLEGSRIGGDVIVIGGAYKHGTQAPLRGEASKTILYAGYEQELRRMMRNPTELVAPQWSARYVGFRILAVLFWFVVSLVLTLAMPETISQGVTRLQLTNVRVAIIGFVGAAIIGAGISFSLHYLPTALSALVSLVASLFILLVWLFGRVVTAAATGRWLQRKFLPIGRNSESVALLLGTVFWVALSSLPYIWPLVVAVTIVVGIGLALTVRFRRGWNRVRPRWTSPQS